MKNGLAVTITYLLIVLILIAIPFLVLPALISSLSSLINIDWTTVINNVVQRLDQTAAELSKIPLVGSKLQESFIALADLLEQSSTSAQNVPASVVTLESMVGTIGRTLGGLVSVLGPIISGVVSLVFLLLLSLQITIGGGVVRKGLVDILPSPFKDEINRLLDGIIFIWRSFLSGQVRLMFAMGFATWLLNVLLGTPQPLFLGILAGFLELIPNIGPIIAWIPAAIFALIFGSTRFVEMDPFVFALIVSAGYLLLSALENQLLVPRIMGSAVDLPPLVVLIGVIVGGSTLGIAGIFLAVPVMATGKEVFLYLYGKVLETEGDLPSPESTEVEDQSFRKLLQSATTRVRGWFSRSKKSDA
jgi:predicted PurR-regulated permease PerM